MPTKYTQAIFQPTIRPSWAGILSYISDKEKAEILEAIIKYPTQTGIKSKFWEDTIKPDIDEQYEKFKETCEARGRGARTYWGEHKLSISSTQGEHKDNFLKDKDKDKDKDKVNGKEKENKEKENYPLYFQKWLAYKKERKQKYTPIGEKQCLEKLNKLSNWNDEIAVRIVDQSIERGWSGLFELKEPIQKVESEEERQWKEWFEKNKTKETMNEHTN